MMEKEIGSLGQTCGIAMFYQMEIFIIFVVCDLVLLSIGVGGEYIWSLIIVLFFVFYIWACEPYFIHF